MNRLCAASVCLLLTAFSQALASAEPTGQDILKASQKAYDALTSYSDSSTAMFNAMGERHEATYTTRLLRPNFYRIEWTESSPSGPVKGVCRSDGTASDITLDFGKSPAVMTPMKTLDLKDSLDAITFGTGIPIAMDVPGIFFPKETGGGSILTASLSSSPQEKTTIDRQADEKIAQTDCFTITITDVMHVKSRSGQTDDYLSTTQLSIGKQDFLIRRLRDKFPGVGGEETMTISHRDILVNPHLSPEDLSH